MAKESSKQYVAELAKLALDPKIAISFSPAQLVLMHNVLQDVVVTMEDSPEEEFNEEEYELLFGIVYDIKFAAEESGIASFQELFLDKE